MTALKVMYGGMSPKPKDVNAPLKDAEVRDHYSEAWRVAVDDEIGIGLLAVPFGREQDAEAAMQAMIRAGLDCREAIYKAGFAATRKVALEAMQW